MNDLLPHDEDLPAITPTLPFLVSHFKNNTLTSTQHMLFNPDRLTRREAYSDLLSPAAVLIPIIEYQKTLHVLFTLRSSHLNKHAGQISFPGGRIESNDADAQTAALRESFEEIGLLPSQVTVLGNLGFYITSTGFQITPVVGLVDQQFIPKCNLNEVSSTLLVPLHFLMNPGHYELQTRAEQNQQRSFYSVTYQEHVIWGATAGMLFALYEALLSSTQPTL